MSELGAAPSAPQAALAPAPRVLVLGDDTRSFLAIVRSLGRAGFAVHAAPFDFTSPALASRYVGKVHRLPPYSLSADAWVAALSAVIAADGIDLVIPCDDRTLLPLDRHANALAPARLALPNRGAMAAFFDKAETRRLAQEEGVPVAPGRLLGDGERAEALAAEFGLPLALKPRSSYTLGQAGAKSSVRIVRTCQALAEALARIERPGEWLAEGFFHGVGIGVSVLADEGVVLEAFQHRRLREASETGGSSDRVSEPLDTRLLAAVEALARRTALSGVAMFEFRRAAGSDAYILLEVNARFWGSLPLAVAAGCDFPADLARLLLGGTRPAAAPYRTGLRRRDFGGEYYRVLKAAEGAGPVVRLSRLAAGLSRLTASAATGRGIDTCAADDAAPWRAEKALLASRVGGAVAKRLPFLARRSRRAERAVAKIRDALARGPASLVVLCHGNICRSPFAAALLEAKRAGLDLRIVSRGTIPLEGRTSPREGAEAAGAFGVDLDPHRSAWLRVEEAEAADAVLVFDAVNVEELKRLGARANVLRLADLIGRPAIADPYGRGADAFAACYRDIEQAIDRLVERLR
ncbi:MAG TPA: ATP-grasp domain-containing protein [Allosphingosinicella sp.]|jgi:protein-tyrosine-phosphatase/predicted ATP-grasp superfamily ATP-dependent carboligase